MIRRQDIRSPSTHSVMQVLGNLSITNAASGHFYSSVAPTFFISCLAHTILPHLILHAPGSLEDLPVSRLQLGEEILKSGLLLLLRLGDRVNTKTEFDGG
jgi:hypothetical protein